MDIKELGGKIAANAPMLGSLLGSFVPGIGNVAGGAIGLGIKALAGAFGLAPDSTPDQVSAAIEADPQAALKLRMAEMDYGLQMRQKDIDELTVHLKDVDSARQRQVDSEKATGKRDYNLYILAWTVVMGFFGLCLALMKIVLPPGQNDVVFMLFGGLNSGFSLVLAYFFGSSSGSAHKTEILAKK